MHITTVGIQSGCTVAPHTAPASQHHPTRTLLMKEYSSSALACTRPLRVALISLAISATVSCRKRATCRGVCGCVKCVGRG